AAAGAVAGNELDHRRVRPVLLVPLHRQAEPAHRLVELERGRAGGRVPAGKQVVARTVHVGAVARAHQGFGGRGRGGAREQRAAAGVTGAAGAAGTGRWRHGVHCRRRAAATHPRLHRPPAGSSGARGLHEGPPPDYDAPMATHPILQDDQVDRLADLLEQRAVPFGGLGLEALDGFFSALAVGPDGIDEAQWQAVVWGGPAPRWNDDDEAREVAALLAG